MKKLLLFQALILISVLITGQPSLLGSDRNESSFIINSSSLMNDPVKGSNLLSTIPLAISADEKPIKRGDMIIGGSASLGFENSRYKSGSLTTKNNFFNFGVSPRVLFFIVDKLALGAHVNFGFGLRNDIFNYYTGVGPELRYYTSSGLFVKADVSYLYSKYETFTSNLLNFTPGIGFAIFLNKNVALEPCLNYSIDLDFRNNETRYTNHNVGISIGLTIFL